MVSDESIKEVIKECLEGEHSEVFKSLFSQIRRMEKEQVEALIKKMAEEEKGKIMDLNAEIYILENILENMEFDPLVLTLDDIKIKTTLGFIKTVIASQVFEEKVPRDQKLPKSYHVVTLHHVNFSLVFLEDFIKDIVLYLHRGSSTVEQKT